MHILFLCTGNICRSPMAERLSVVHQLRAGDPNLQFSSAGTRAAIGEPIHPIVAEILKREGADASNFEARQLTPKIASSADLIVTMTREHRGSALELAPRMLNRTFLLAEVSELVMTYGARTISELVSLRPQLSGHAVPNILDPIGQGSTFFEEVSSHIATLLPQLLEVCRASSQEGHYSHPHSKP